MKAIQTFTAAALMTVAMTSHAEIIYGITNNNPTTNLVRFDSATPSAYTVVGAISGVAAGQVLRGIDFRPATGELYALSSINDLDQLAVAQLYTIDLASAQATAVGGAIALTGNTSIRVSLDFNPVTDRLRIVTGSGQSYRLNVDTGALIQDTNIVTAGTGIAPQVSGIAYSNNVAGASATTLYAYDFLLDNLGTIGGLNGVPSPNGGLLNLIGNSGIDSFSGGLGFDISGATGIGYISVDDFLGSPGFQAEFFTVNLATGALTQIGADDLFTVLDISVAPQPKNGVPEPGSFALALLALAAAASVTRRRQRTN